MLGTPDITTTAAAATATTTTATVIVFAFLPSFYAALIGGGRILRRTLSVRLSVRPVIVTERHVAPPSELQ